MGVLSNLEPTAVFGYFEDICNIPHGSGNMEQISAYCIDFAKKHSLAWYSDSLHNVIIRKPASSGYESHQPVILQAHLDMVCEKLPETNFDFNTDALRLAIDGDFVYADGTTLGGDDGIAVAMILAILADKTVAHPPLEAVFTTDEETGMFGANGLDMAKLNGKMLINIDSEQMGVITVGCAGGARADITLPLNRIANCKPCYEITVGGLVGGHSGVDINKGRMNANKLMGELLDSIDCVFNVISINGGSKDNVITRECKCVIAAAEIYENFNDFVLEHKCEYEPDLFVDIKSVEMFETAFDSASTSALVNLINKLPNGIIKMSDDVEGLVQTSLNLGVLKSDKCSAFASFGLRSSVSAEKTALLDCLNKIADDFGASFNQYGHYPAWEYRKISPLRDTMQSVYSDMFGVVPDIEIIHAGLECGLFASRIEDFDAVSIGPDLYDIHTARERLSVSSTKALYGYILKVLEKL